MIRNWARGIIRWCLRDDCAIESPTYPNDQWQGGVQEIIRIYEIGNGYIIYHEGNNQNQTNPGRGIAAPRSQPSKLIYCKDHEGVAEHLLQRRALGKLNN